MCLQCGRQRQIPARQQESENHDACGCERCAELRLIGESKGVADTCSICGGWLLDHPGMEPCEGVVVESTWHDVENGVWEERIHLRYEDERGESTKHRLTRIPGDTHE